MTSHTAHRARARLTPLEHINHRTNCNSPIYLDVLKSHFQGLWPSKACWEKMARRDRSPLGTRLTISISRPNHIPIHITMQSETWILALSSLGARRSCWVGQLQRQYHRPHTLNATHATTIPLIEGVSVSCDPASKIVVWCGDLEVFQQRPLSFYSNVRTAWRSAQRIAIVDLDNE